MTNVHAGYRRSVTCLWLLVALTAGALCVPQLRAQAPKAGNAVQVLKLGGAAKPAGPCCQITRMDAATGVVTAKVNSTGQSFQFKVADAALLSSLKEGQAVYANFKTQKVSVDGVEPCGNIVTLAKGGVGGGAFQQDVGGAANPAGPCCNITGIDATGRVAAKDNTTGKTFQFQVNDNALLISLHVGQSVSANFSTNQVAIAGAGPCCNIIGAGAGPQGGLANTAGTVGSGSSGSSGVIQSQDANAPGLVAELTEATRAEGILTVKVRFRNTSKQRVGLTLTKNYECEKYYVVWGNNKQTVLKDSKGDYAMPVREGCNDTAVTIAPSQAWVWWGKFAAPPAMVTKIELYTPLAPPFEDVPVTNK